MSHPQSSVDRNEHTIALTRSLREVSTVFAYSGNPVLHLGYMDSRTASSPDPRLQLVVLRLRWFMTGLSVQTAFLVTVGMVLPGCGFVRGNRSEGCCGTSEITVEDQQWEGV